MKTNDKKLAKKDLSKNVSTEFDNEMWKERVQMNSITLPRHVHHWIANSVRETIFV